MQHPEAVGGHVSGQYLRLTPSLSLSRAPSATKQGICLFVNVVAVWMSMGVARDVGVVMRGMGPGSFPLYRRNNGFLTSGNRGV